MGQFDDPNVISIEGAIVKGVLSFILLLRLLFFMHKKCCEYFLQLSVVTITCSRNSVVILNYDKLV